MVKKGDLLLDVDNQRLLIYQGMDDGDPPHVEVKLLTGGLRTYNAKGLPMRIIPKHKKDAVMQALEAVRQAQLRLDDELSECKLI